MASLAQQKQYLAQLNSSRLKTKKESDQSETSASSNINFAELLIVLGAAITIDLIDVLDLTGFGAIIARIIDVPALLGIWLWLAMKHKGAKPGGDHTFRILLTFLGEISPFGMVPFWTIFIIYTIAKEKRAGRKLLSKSVKRIRKR